jgi:hypothetical protein
VRPFLVAGFCLLALLSIGVFANISAVNLDASFVYGKF